MAGTGKEITGTRNTIYDLVSILYHGLQGAETYEMYVADAEKSGDAELAQFFREVQKEEQKRSNRAKELLSNRLSG
jgi:rubrerythrin